MEEIISQMRETEIFKGIEPRQIEEMLGIALRVKFSAGEIIMHEGETGDTMYIILDGTVEVVKRLILAEVEDEDMGPEKDKVFTRLDATQHAVFGEIALLENQKRTATIRALTNCEFFAIRKDDFLNLAQKDCMLGYQVVMNLARIVSARLRKADEDTIKLTTALSIILKQA